MKNLLFNLKAVQTGSYKAEVGAKTFWKSEPEPKLEQKQIILASQLQIMHVLSIADILDIDVLF